MKQRNSDMTAVYADQTVDVPEMTERVFERLSEIVYLECGIALTSKKRTMLASRLIRRLSALGLATFDEYCNLLADLERRDAERIHLINAVTTNKTEFFRERRHFAFLRDTGLPSLIKTRKFRVFPRISAWSAAASTGEEPYTMAMVLSEFFEGQVGKFGVTATDISTQVLETARRAVYPGDVVAPVPADLKTKYLMKGRGRLKGYYRVVPELRQSVSFVELNLMDYDYGMKSQMDVIFLRNVIIYFDHETRVRLMDQMYRQLSPGGYLFIGHSETLTGISDRFRPIAPTIYQRPN